MENHANAPTNNDGENSQGFKGIRLRKWGKWVSEVRIPKCRTKIWLGSYDKAEQAARAYDAAVFCLRGTNAKFNFPNSIPAIPSASSLSPEQIQLAAAEYALGQIPCNNIVSTAEVPVSPSRSSSVAEIEMSADGNVSGEQGSASWETLFGDSVGNNPCLNLEKFPSIDSVTLDLSPPTEEQDSFILFDPTELWNF